MFKIAGVIFDQYDDVDNKYGFSLDKIPFKLIKTAQEESAHPDDYALVFITPSDKLYKYPISDPINTYASAWYFVKTAENLPISVVPYVAARIANAIIEQEVPVTEEIEPVIKIASLAPERVPDSPVPFVITRDEPTLKELMELEKDAAKLTYQQRKALPDSAFALVVKDPKTGRKIRKYPIHDEAHVRNAIVRFAQHHQKLPPAWRSKIARKIKQAAKRFGIQISPDNVLNKYASYDRGALLDALYNRITLAKDEQIRKAYEKVAEAVAFDYSLPIEKVAQIVEEMDKATGFDKIWEVIGDPYGVKTAQAKKKKQKKKKQSPISKVTNPVKVRKLLQSAKALDVDELL